MKFQCWQGNYAMRVNGQDEIWQIVEVVKGAS